MPDDRNDNNSQTPRDPKIPGMPGGKKPTRTGWLYFILACALLGYAFFNMGSGFANSSNTVKLATSEMVNAIKQDRVDDLTYTVVDGSVTGHYWKASKDKGDTSELKSFSSTYVGSDSLAELMAEHPDTKYIVNTNDPDFWGDLAMSVLPTIALIAIMFYFMRQMMGANNRNMQFGKTNAKTNEATRPKVKFEDVAGVDEAVEELEEIRDFLSDPDRYRKLGAKIPRGVLLVGPPGTGKTLLAKAVAGEAGVPFFSISGSDFVEMFVGVGASRVRDLFKEAKSQAPSIIFIDEIDAVGRQRGAGLGGGHDEREQTLNQLLVEMDGFEESESVILIAATNRPDILDPALLRPGRFDRQVTVDRPDVKGREQILRVHAENKPMDEDVKFEKLAQMTVGFTGADLANLLNESALLAARRHRSVISMDEVEESMERVIAGPQRKGRVMTEAERTTIAYHESGHALVGHILEHSDPVHKISIVSRGQALGYTLQLPQEDHFLKTKNEMLDELAVFLGGRVAEELMCDDITSGASNDLERATKMAREMVTRLGMSEELGTQVFGEAQHQVFLGRDYADHQDYSEETARRIDIEVQRIMREAHRRAVEILDARRDQLDLMAKVLLERETVEGDAVNALLDNEWDAYLEREGDILAAKEERNAKAAGMPTKKRSPRMSEEELTADAAALCSAKAYNSAYAKGEQMINETMYARGAESSIIREIFSYGLERKAQIGAENVFDFSLGNPSVPAPAAVAESIKKALELPSDQLHGYTPAPGLPQCRAAVADSLNRRFGTSYEGKDVFMTVGAAASLTCTLNAVTNPGDEVVVIAPYFPEYRVWIEKAGCTCVEALADEDTFQLSVSNVLKAITDKTAAVIIDSPNNPTGAVYTRDTLTRLANVLREANAQRDPENPIMLISDEPYREIVYGAEVPWVPSIYEHTIVCYSYSKSLSLPGERVGWILVPNTNPQAARLMPAVAGAARTLGFVCAPALFQRVIIDCIDEPSDVEAYARNRTALTDALAEYGYTYVEPDGAFYLWVKALEPDANAFCERAKKYELLAVPSDSFGMPGWFRLGYCVSYETIVNSLPAWKQLADEYRRK